DRVVVIADQEGEAVPPLVARKIDERSRPRSQRFEAGPGRVTPDTGKIRLRRRGCILSERWTSRCERKYHPKQETASDIHAGLHPTCGIAKHTRYSVSLCRKLVRLLGKPRHRCQMLSRRVVASTRVR